MVGPGGGALDEQGRSPAHLGSVGVGRTSQGAALNERRPEGINGGVDRGSHISLLLLVKNCQEHRGRAD